MKIINNNITYIQIIFSCHFLELIWLLFLQHRLYLNHFGKNHYIVCYSVIADDSEQEEELASVRELKNISEESGVTTLEECFKVRALLCQFYNISLC